MVWQDEHGYLGRGRMVWHAVRWDVAGGIEKSG